MLILGVLALGAPIAAGAVVGLVLDPPSTRAALAVLLFLAFALLAELEPVPLEEEGVTSVSLAFVFILATVILFGWQEAVLIAGGSALVAQIVEHKPVLRTGFNTSVYVVSAFTAALPLFVLGRAATGDPVAITAYALSGGAVEELERRAEHQARLRAAENLVRVVDAKDAYTGAHSERVAVHVEGIARRLGLNDELVEQLKLAGRLHDLGKIAVSDTILQKPTSLTAEEMEQVSTHPHLGASLLDGMEIRPVDVWIRHHHEHWDGSGYPDRLEGEDIPLGSRVILVADAYDAITSDRSYSPASTPERAVAELRAKAGIQFDPVVVAALESYLTEAGLLAVDARERATSLGWLIAS